MKLKRNFEMQVIVGSFTRKLLYLKAVKQPAPRAAEQIAQSTGRCIKSDILQEFEQWKEQYEQAQLDSGLLNA